MSADPARLGLRGDLLARFEAAGWVAGGRVVDAAAGLLDAVARGPDPGGARQRIAAIAESEPGLASDLLADPVLGEAAVAVAGASRALAETAASDPAALRAAARGEVRPLPAAAKGATPDEAAALLRAGVRAAMLGVAVGDLTGRLPMPEVGRALSDLADAAAAAALEAAASVLSGAPPAMAVIAMGKWGGRELNYASDVDVLFVHGGGDERADDARRVAEGFMRIMAGTGDGAFRVDADLRPEGKLGPLVRTLESYRAYWERWAETWELQALLKARPVAGDPGLGAAFVAAAEPFVFPDTLGAEAVREVRAMKRRTEAAAAGEAGIEIKRGVGGIRDVEFAVQLLQLVHGRSDPALRGANTLEALAVLGEGGYVRPEDAADLGDAYHWLRDVEHRLQLHGLRQTHTLPADPSRRERLAKAMGYRDGARTALASFDDDLVARRTTVRTIHERLFYRPLLEAFAASPAVRLTEQGAVRQLAALGYADTEAARRAFADLTGGLSRRSRLMQQMLPLMLDWLSASPDPDLGLAQLRLLVTSAPDNAALVAALRDDPVAAERLCTMLGTSRLLGRFVDRLPAAVAHLGSDDGLAGFPAAADLADEARRLVGLRGDRSARVGALRRFAQSQLLRIAGSDLAGAIDHRIVGRRLTAVGDALAAAALQAAVDETADGGASPPPVAVVAMGKWGGAELNYASDLDALLIHGTGGEDATAAALRVAERFVAILTEVAADGPGRGVDLGLRPEGGKGPLIRSLESYRAYYERWADTWEFHALLRARPAAGDPEIGAAFMALTGPLAHRAGFGEAGVRAVRAMKARIEAERVPPGEDPAFHMKLGPGGMADVEWTAQLLQLLHGAAEPAVRTASTIEALERLTGAGLLAASDGEVLMASYGFCGSVRNRLYLQAGRPRDSLPADPAEVTRLARSLGYERDPRAALREEYRRVTRRARRVVEQVFYGGPERGGGPGP